MSNERNRDKQWKMSDALTRAREVEGPVTRRAEIDRARRDELRAALERGDAPEELTAVALRLSGLRRGGGDFAGLEDLGDLARRSGATEWAAALDHAFGVGRPCAGSPETGIPDLDVAHLFGDVPVALARVREMEAVAVVAPDMPAVFLASAVSCALAAKVVGVMRNANGSPWIVYPHLYFAPEVPSGGAKTLCLNLSGLGENGPLDRAAAAHADRMRGLASDDATRRGRMSLKRTRLVARLDDDSVLEEIRDLDRKLAAPKVEVPDGPLRGRISPPQFIRKAQRSGFIPFVPDEGKGMLAAFMAGRDGFEEVEALLCAFSGSVYANDTIEGERRGDRPRFPAMHAAGVVPLQPRVLVPDTEDASQLLKRLGDRGLFGRFLACRPRLLRIEERVAIQSADQPTGSQGDWYALLRRIAFEVVGDHPLAPTEPHRVEFTDGAVAAVLAYQARTTNDVAPGGRLEGHVAEPLMRRLGDHAARLAVVLAVMRCGGFREAEVLESDAARAVRALETYFEPHGLAVANRTILDRVGDDGEIVLQHLRTDGEITARELRRRLGRGWGAGPNQRVSRLEAALKDLSAKGLAVVERAPRSSVVVRLVGGA